MESTTLPVVLAVDIGGTKVDAALVAVDGTIIHNSLHRASTGPRSDRDGLIQSVRSVIGAAIGEAGDSPIRAAGIGAAGPLDQRRGLISPKNLPNLKDFAIEQLVQECLPGKPVALRLDGICFALAEQWIGATQEATNSMAIVVSTGVGGGIILNSVPVMGRSGNAGHIGQMRLAGGTQISSQTGSTLEEMASGPQTVSWARSHGWEGETGEELAEAYSQGERIALQAVRRSATAVGLAVANAVTLLDLETVVVGGGFANVASDYIDQVKNAVNDAALFSYVRQVTVVRSPLGSRGPILGAAALAFQITSEAS